jgi:hypothetical protein
MSYSSRCLPDRRSPKHPIKPSSPLQLYLNGACWVNLKLCHSMCKEACCILIGLRSDEHNCTSKFKMLWKRPIASAQPDRSPWHPSAGAMPTCVDALVMLPGQHLSFNRDYNVLSEGFWDLRLDFIDLCHAVFQVRKLQWKVWVPQVAHSRSWMQDDSRAFSIVKMYLPV